MAALRRLAVHAYCLHRRALPSTFFGSAWPESLRWHLENLDRFSRAHQAGAPPLKTKCYDIRFTPQAGFVRLVFIGRL